MRLLSLISLALIGAFISSCGQTINTGSRKEISSLKSEGDAQATSSDFVNLNVNLEDNLGNANLSLVDNAFTGIKADLIGGVACWGDLATPFSGTSLKVRKNAAGCSIIAKEIHLKEANVALIFRNNDGLQITQDREAAFRYDEAGRLPRELQVKIASGFTTAADAQIKFSAKMLEVDTTAIQISNDEINISSAGSVAAYPNIRINSSGKFNSKLYVNIGCATNSATNLECVPGVDAQAGSAQGTQRLSLMNAAVIKIAGTDVTGFPGSLTYARTKALFDGVAAASKFSPVLPANGFSGDLNGMSYTTPAAGEKVLLVVRFAEVVTNVTYESYKIFVMNGL